MRSSLVLASVLSVALATPFASNSQHKRVANSDSEGEVGAQCGTTTEHQELKCAEGLECKYSEELQGNIPDGTLGTCQAVEYGKENDPCGAFTTEPQPLCGTYLTCKLDDPQVPDRGGKCVPIPNGKEDGRCGYKNGQETRRQEKIICWDDTLECVDNPLPQNEGEHYDICKLKPPGPGEEGAECRKPDEQEDQANPLAVCKEGLECRQPVGIPELHKTCQPLPGTKGAECPLPGITYSRRARAQIQPETPAPCKDGLECKSPESVMEELFGICQPRAGTEGAQCGTPETTTENPNPQPLPECKNGLKCKLSENPANTLGTCKRDNGGPDPGNEGAQCSTILRIAPCKSGFKCIMPEDPAEKMGTCKAIEPGTEGAKCPIDTRGETTLKPCNQELTCEPDPRCGDCPGTCTAGTMSILPVPGPTGVPVM